MKKIIKQKDGTEIIFEGTPDEISQLEEELNNNESFVKKDNKKKKRLLVEGH